MEVQAFNQSTHQTFMKEAIKEALQAQKLNEVPIGAIVVSPEGTIVGRSYNQVESQGTQTAHAELLAILEAAKKQGDWRLDGHWLYVTLEPCMMCMGLIRLSRFSGVVFGTSSPLYGFALDNTKLPTVYKKDIFIKNLEDESTQEFLKEFFKKQREKGE